MKGTGAGGEPPTPEQVAGVERTLSELMFGLMGVVEHNPFWGLQLVSVAVRHLMETAGAKGAGGNESIYAGASRAHSPAEACDAIVTALERAEIIPPGGLEVEQAGANHLSLLVRPGTCVFRHYERWRERTGAQEPVPVCMRCLAFAAAMESLTGRSYMTKLREWSPEPNGRGCRISIEPTLLDSRATFSGEEGEIRLAGERMLLLPVQEYQNLLDEIHRYRPELVSRVIYQSAYLTGVSMAARVAPMVGNSVKCFNYLVGLLNNSGEGELKVEFFEPGTARGKVRGKNLAVAARAARMRLFRFPQVVDDHCAGRLAGYASGILGRPVTCEEVKCTARGDTACVFELRPSTLGRSSGGGVP